MAGGAARALGEIAIRVRDLEAMRKFYEEVVGLEFMRRFPNIVFFRLAEGYGGHTQVLALFDGTDEPKFSASESPRTTLHHLALEIDLADYDKEKARLEARGVKLNLQTFGWVHWRSIFFHDPEGNSIELVCYDESVRE